MGTEAATHNLIMIAKPSIAFDEFSGTAKEVTARYSKGRNVLSVRAKQSKVVTPVQASSRNSLSKISRAYKQLSDSQIHAWEVLAEHLKGISTFGLAAEMTAHNAFVRINTNRQLVNMPLLQDAPEYKSDVPEVDYDDLWVTPSFICFTGINPPKDSYRLFVKMSGGQSPGVSSGWSKTVIVASGVQDDWSEANVTRLYADKIGYSPKLGEKVFIEFWWLDSETGFTGESMAVTAICKSESQVEGEIYVPRNRFTADHITRLSSGATVVKFSEENAEGSALMIADIEYKNTSIVAGISGDMEGLPDTFTTGRVYFPGRATSRNPWAVGLYECYTSIWRGEGSWQVAHRYSSYGKEAEVFGISAFVNF